MHEPADPNNEPARLAALQALGILDRPPEERFDRYTRMARRLFDVPIALVSLVDADRQWFKSRSGLDATETSRAISFCGHTIHDTQGPMVVHDAQEDARFHDNPLVIGAPNIRFYAGHPLVTEEGFALGTLCLIDERARGLELEDRELLADLASMVMGEISATMRATTDGLTGLTNRRGFDTLAAYALSVCHRTERPATLLYLDLDGFKPINDTWGHAEGDRALVEFGRLLRSVFRETDVVARMGGDEFAVLCTGAAATGVGGLVQRFREALGAANGARESEWSLACSIGSVPWEADRHAAVSDLLADADARMYEQKRAAVA